MKIRSGCESAWRSLNCCLGIEFTARLCVPTKGRSQRQGGESSSTGSGRRNMNLLEPEAGLASWACGHRNMNLLGPEAGLASWAGGQSGLTALALRSAPCTTTRFDAQPLGAGRRSEHDVPFEGGGMKSGIESLRPRPDLPLREPALVPLREPAPLAGSLRGALPPSWPYLNSSIPR